MATSEKVVVVVVPEKLSLDSPKLYASRIKALGLTAYGDTDKQSWDRLKQMFGVFVRTHRRVGDLEKLLNASGLDWCYESAYKGPLPIESIKKPQYVVSCRASQDVLWKLEGEALAA